MIVTTRNIKKHIQDIIDSRCEAGLIAQFDGISYSLFVVPVFEGGLIHSEQCVVYTRPSQMKLLKSKDSVLNFAVKHGIQIKHVFFKDGSSHV